MIDTNTKLTNFLATISDDNIIAVDTEFLRINTYYPKPCVIQIATQNGCGCIDLLSSIDTKILKNYLYGEDKLLVFHSGRQDLEIFYNLFEGLPKNIFDTQICGSFLGYSHQVSYGDLVKDTLGVELEKKYSRFDWTRRPLPKDVEKYALDDVIYLLQLYDKFKNYQYYDYIIQDCRELLRDELYNIDTSLAYKKLKGIGGLGKKYQAIAISLCAYREELATLKNKPRKWIIDDQTIFDYATGRKDIPQKITANLQEFDIEVTKEKPINTTEKNQMKKLQKEILAKALKYNLNPELIASKKDMLKFIRDENSQLNQTWRKNL